MKFQMFKLDLEKAEEPEFKLDLEKAEEPEIKLSLKKHESCRKTSTSDLLTTPKL